MDTELKSPGFLQNLYVSARTSVLGLVNGDRNICHALYQVNHPVQGFYLAHFNGSAYIDKSRSVWLPLSGQYP